MLLLSNYNILSKLYKCNANIYFNKQCLKNQLTPSYANIKVPHTSPAHKHTQKKLPNIRIKDEIRYLYTKKQQINLQIYHLHLSLANTYDSWWSHMQHTIEEKLRKHISSKYKTIDKKTTKSNISTERNTTDTTHIPPQSSQLHRDTVHQQRNGITPKGPKV